MTKAEDTLQALQKSRVFLGNFAENVRRKHGTRAAQPFLDSCQVLDETIRALRDAITVADAILSEQPILTKIKNSQFIH